MAEFKLHCFAQSGNAYKVALMLQFCKAEWEPHFVDYFNGATKTDEFKNLNEMNEVPVLEHKGLSLTQSGVILDYLSKHFNKFGPETESEHREILRWIFWDNHKFTSYIATYRALLNFFKTGETEVTSFLRQRFLISLKILNSHLAENNYIIGNRMTFADLSLCGYLFWPEEFGIDWNNYSNIASWLDKISSHDNWVHPYQLMPRESSKNQ